MILPTVGMFFHFIGRKTYTRPFFSQLDETPSSKVYEQLGALAKQNPWFVANLQTIMASSAITSPLPSCAMAALKAGNGNGTGSSQAPADPAQAALILLLAGKVAKGPTEQTSNLLQGIVKQMTNGVKASEILRTILPSSNTSHNEADLIQTAINMAGTNSTSNTVRIFTPSTITYIFEKKIVKFINFLFL